MVGFRTRAVYLVLSVGLFLVASTFQNTCAQAISPIFFGQNAWMPDSTGSRFLNGKVHDTWDLIEESGVQVIRFGGISSDRDMPTNYQYLRMIDSMRTHGMEPVIQVSYWKGQYSAQQAADLVKFLNVTHKKNIKYFSIGNEPDHGSSYGFTKPEQVAPYIKAFASAMKSVDPSIKIIGPDCAWYNKPIIHGLTNPGGPYDVTGKDANGHYYIDILSFHEYPFKGDQDRSQIIKNLKTEGKFEDKLKDLKSRLAACNSKHGRSGGNILKMAVTEANIAYKDPSNDGVKGIGTESFIGGQFWVEILGLAMKHGVEFVNFWGVTNAFGYLEKDTHKKRPTFHHFKMVADNFRGVYCDGKSNQSNVKTYGSKDGNQVAVIITNQSSGNKYKYTVKLNNGAVSGSDAVKLNIDAGINKEFKDEIAAEATTLLVFNSSGDIIRKCEYKLNGNADKDLPPTCTELTAAPAVVEIVAPSLILCGNEGRIVLTASSESGFTFQWNKEDKPIEGASGVTYTAEETGNYSVTATKNGVAVNSVSVEVIDAGAPLASITTVDETNICKSHIALLSASTGPEYTYVWKLDGEDIPASNVSDYQATVPGIYTVTISNSCGEATSNTIVISSCEAVADLISTEEEGDRNLHSYPNPSGGIFTIEMQTDQLMPDDAVNMEVINAAGQVIHKQRPTQVGGYVRQYIELDRSLPSGLYIVRITAGSKAWSNKVLVSR
jgi:hypothetical protein